MLVRCAFCDSDMSTLERSPTFDEGKYRITINVLEPVRFDTDNSPIEYAQLAVCRSCATMLVNGGTHAP